MGTVTVLFEVGAEGRSAFEEEIGALAEVVHLPGSEPGVRREALLRSTAVLARNTARDLGPGEAGALADARLIQFVTAGVDFIPLGALPSGPVIACNAGAYAEPMAEHALAMMLAAAKRLLIEHAKMGDGEFDQFAPNRMLRGRTVGIFGFGGIGRATARLCRAFGMRVLAVNRQGGGAAEADWLGTPADLPRLLAGSDVLVLAAPLTRATSGLIGRAALAGMRPDAILVNLARGELVDRDALYDHLASTPAFTACIDAWWVEPVRHGRFEMGRPFTDLPNVIASPHNSASVRESGTVPIRRAAANIGRVLRGEAPHHVVDPSEQP